MDYETPFPKRKLLISPRAWLQGEGRVKITENHEIIWEPCSGCLCRIVASRSYIRALRENSHGLTWVTVVIWNYNSLSIRSITLHSSNFFRDYFASTCNFDPCAIHSHVYLPSFSWVLGTVLSSHKPNSSPINSWLWPFSFNFKLLGNSMESLLVDLINSSGLSLTC